MKSTGRPSLAGLSPRGQACRRPPPPGRPPLVGNLGIASRTARSPHRSPVATTGRPRSRSNGTSHSHDGSAVGDPGVDRDTTGSRCPVPDQIEAARPSRPGSWPAAGDGSRARHMAEENRPATSSTAPSVQGHGGRRAGSTPIDSAGHGGHHRIGPVEPPGDARSTGRRARRRRPGGPAVHQALTVDGRVEATAVTGTRPPSANSMPAPARRDSPPRRAATPGRRPPRRTSGPPRRPRPPRGRRRWPPPRTVPDGRSTGSASAPPPGHIRTSLMRSSWSRERLSSTTAPGRSRP